MERLIYQRLRQSKELTAIIATYKGLPAIFYQKAPEDKQWEGEQYPKVVFTIDKFANAQRGTFGALSVEVICSETSKAPEEIEQAIRMALEGVFFTPKAGETFAAKWRETSLIEEAVSERELLINGALISFDLYEYPAIKVSEPDPIAALNEYALTFDKGIIVVGESELPFYFVPTRTQPAVYFNRQRVNCESQTNSTIWLSGIINVHFFAPTLRDRVEWLTELQYTLLTLGEIALLDGSPLFIKDAEYDFTADEIRGQIRLKVEYGIQRKPEYAHTLIKAVFR